MELRDYLSKNNVILIYHHSLFVMYDGRSSGPIMASDVSDILPVASVDISSPHLYFQFGSSDDYYKNFNSYKKKKIKLVTRSFYDFIDGIRDGLI